MRSSLRSFTARVRIGPVVADNRLPNRGMGGMQRNRQGLFLWFTGRDFRLDVGAYRLRAGAFF